MKKHKKINTKKRNFFVIIMLFIFLFFISLISSFSMFDEIPDVCIGRNVQYLDIWLEDYYGISDDEIITIEYTDPVDSRVLDLELGFGTINTQCYEMYYYLTPRCDGCFFTDLIRIETLNEECSANFEVKFNSSKSLNQAFNLQVADNCHSNASEPEVYINLTESIYDNLISWYTFDSTLFDSAYNYEGHAKHIPNYSSISLYGESLDLNDYNKIYLNQSTSEIKGEYSTLSLWFNATSDISNAAFSTMFYCGTRGGGATGLGASFFASENLTLHLKTSGWSGNTTNLKDGQYHHLLYTNNNTLWKVYLDNVLVWTKTVSNVNLSSCFVGGIEDDDYTDLYIDEFAIYNRTLDESDISLLYNSGNGLDGTIEPPNEPTSSIIPDVYMNESQTTYVNLDSYFNYWEDIYIQVNDPIPYKNSKINFYTGYRSGNGDYFEVMLHQNGSLNITSYDRQYNFNITAFACNYTPYEECSNQTFQVYIGTNKNSVIQINPFQAYYNLGFNGTQIFSGNFFYQYYDTIIFSFPDSNRTGTVGSNELNYTILENPTENGTFMIFAPCQINQQLTEVNVLMDLNLTIECGLNIAFYTLTSNGNYNQRVYFTASNENNSLSDYTQIVSGDSTNPENYFVNINEVKSNKSWFDSNVAVFGDTLQSNPTQKQKNGTMFLILFVVVVLTLFFVSPVSVKLAIYIIIIEIILLLFFFTSQQYINPFYPVIITIIFVVYHIIKLLKGGG